jgi:hypothetical protein
MSWYNSSWDYRVKITIESDEVDSTLTDFPVYVDLSDLPSGFHTNCNQTDARDIRVTRSDGTTECAREVVFYDSATDTGELHFKANSLSSSSNTDFYIYYGNSSATEPASDSTYGSENVWDSNYKMVLHLQETSGEPKDSSGNTSPSYEGNLPTDVASKIGKGQTFGDTDYVEIADNSNIDCTSQTISFWLKAHNLGTSGIGRAFWTRRTTFADGQLLFYYSESGQKINWDTFGSGGNRWNTGYSPPTDGTVVYLAFTYDGSIKRMYLDGSSYGSNNNTNGIGNPSSVARIGSNTISVGMHLDADMDEFRLSNTNRSGDWISAEHTNQNTPTTFYTVSTQEANATSENSERGVYIFGYQYSKEDSSSLKTDDATLSTTFDPTNYSNVATEDSVFDTISGDGYLNYLFKAYKSGGGNFLINVKAKSTKAPFSNTVYLQVYNRDTTSWENLDSDSSTSANTVFTLSGGKNSSLTDYYDSDNLLSLRVYQEVS